jgi:PAS domain S-box-containing protein
METIIIFSALTGLLVYVSMLVYIKSQSENEKQLRQIIDLVPNLIFVKDIRGRFILVNKALAELYNTMPEQMVGKTHFDFFHIKDEIDFFNKKDLEVINSGHAIEIEKEVITGNNNMVKYLQTIKMPFQHSGSKAILGVATDITSLEKTKGIIEENELLLGKIFDEAPVPMVLINKDIELVKINKAGKTIGISNEHFGQRLGNSLNCIVAAYRDQTCGHSKECSHCLLRKTIQKTFENKSNQSQIPLIISTLQDKTEVLLNILLSTSYLEINNSPMALVVIEDMTSTLKAEQALIESELRHKQITRAITDYIYTVIINENREVETIHTSICHKITGYFVEEFDNQPDLWFKIILEEDREDVMEFMRNIQANYDRNSIEYRIKCKDGTLRWISSTLVRKLGSRNKQNHYDGIVSDISTRKHTELELEKQNRLFNTLLNNLPIGIIMVNAKDGSNLIVNKHARELLKNDLSTIYNAFQSGTNKLYDPEKVPVYLGMQGIESHVDDIEIEYMDGSRIPLEIMGSPVIDSDNRIWASLISFYDITERKNAEYALRESEKKLSIIFEYSRVGIALSDSKGNIQYMNPAFCNLIGYQPDKAFGKNFRLFTDPKDIDAEINLIKKLRNREIQNANFEKKYIKQDKTEIWVRLQVSCFRDIRGEVTNFIAIAEDITEQKTALDLLKISEEKFRNIFNSSNDAILITDFKGKILELNQITLQRSGFTMDQLKKTRLTDIIAPADKKEAQIQFANISQNKPNICQTSYINIKGEKVYIEVVGHTINYDGKKAALLISRDITERMITQQKILNAIIQAEEKERTYFSQELHDGIGPILSTVKLYLQWIQDPDSKTDKLSLINDALNTIEEAITSLKEVSNKLSPNVLKKFGLETAIQSFIKKIVNLDKVKFSINITLKNRIRHEIEIMLYRVFVEAINNSLKYAGASNILINIHEEDSSLKAAFRDDGKGFEINQSLSYNSGNGLFNMQNRVQTYEGIFVLKSNPGKGTEITITIPFHKFSTT